jgi:RNase P subunit RPR2
VSAEQLAVTAHCIECNEVWLPADEARWRAYLDTANKIVFYCAECARREFDSDWARRIAPGKLAASRAGIRMGG